MNAILSPERATRFDHRRQAATVAAASLAAVAFGMTLASLHAEATAAAMAAAPIPVAAWLGTVHAFVDADLSTLRSRRLLRTRSIPWPEVHSLKAVSTSARERWLVGPLAERASAVGVVVGS